MQIHFSEDMLTVRVTIPLAIYSSTNRMNLAHAVAQQLEQIEQEMKQLALWSSETPTPAQLASVQPFACDTLTFEQWLQFMLLPRFRLMLAQQQALPKKMAVAPAAEVALSSAAQPLVMLLEELDRLINDGCSLLTPEKP